MTRDRSDAIVLTYDPGDGPQRRLTFEPRSDGTYERIEAERQADGTWRTVGRAYVASVSVETPAEVAP